MRYSAKLLGLAALTALMVPLVQIPGFSQEPRDLLQPERLLDEQNLATTAQSEKQLQSKAAPVGPEAKGGGNQTKQMDGDAEPLLRVEGVLEPGDSTFTDDNSLYDTYTFEVEAGQAVMITLESEEFDTYLLLRDSQGESITQNNDISDDNRNSSIAVVLPEAGTYQVIANAYDDTQQGAYRLTVTLTQPDSPAVKKFEADELNRQGRRLDQQARYLEALDYYERSLAIRQEIGDRNGEATSLNNIGGIYSSQGQYQEALRYYERSLAIRAEIGDRSGQASPLNNIGFIYASQGQYQEALSYYERSLTISTELGDQNSEATSLNNIGSIYYSQGQYQEALSYHEHALTICTEIGDRNGEANSLNNIGTIYHSQGQYQEALSYYERSLTIRTELGDQNSEASSLNNIGAIYDNQGQYQRALSYYDRVLFISTEIGDHNGEARSLNNIGGIYASQSEYQEALSYYERALAISTEIGDRDGEARLLNNIGGIYNNQSQYQKALRYYEQALAIFIEIGNRSGEAISLNNIGLIYNRQSQHQEALSYYEHAFTLLTEIGDRSGAATTLGNLGSIYDNQGQYQEALDYHERSLAVFTEIGSLSGQARALNNIGHIYDSQGQYQEALSYYERSLSIEVETGNRNGQAISLGNIGGVYDSQGQYQKALSYYERGLAIDIEIGDRQGESTSLNNIGSLYYRLGQYQKALDYYERALAIRNEIGDRSGEASSLSNIGFFYVRQSEYQKALSYYERALDIVTEIGDRHGEAILLNNFGGLYNSEEQYQEALSYYEQALNIYTEVGDRNGEATLLNNIGSIYAIQNQHQEALSYYQRALAIQTEIGDRDGEATSLHNIAYSLKAQNQPELAIVFYKQSVNVYESIRSQLGGLDTELQSSYIDSIADTYRKLADLLLQQNRVREAQRVLDLLKVQELDDYLHNVRGTEQTATGLDLWESEQRILALYDQTIQEGAELAALEAKPSLTAAETQRRDELLARQDELRGAFQAFRDREDVQAAIAQLRTSTDGQNIELSHFNQLQNSLADLDTNAVLLYPLILDNRLELVLITPYGAPIRRAVEVESADLNRAIVELGQALKTPETNAVAPAQQLYQWLIAELEEDLAAANAKTIIYAPDGALRYIPLAALHDGDQWLAERFAVSHITAASLIDFTARPSYRPDSLELLVAACVQCSFENINGYRFADLPYAGVEVETLAAQILNTEMRLNAAFKASELRTLMRRFPVVHLATHAKFLQGEGGESFIVTGDGGSVSLREMQSWNLDADLVVLSACETAVGEAQLGSGVEILGFGYQMQEAGAKAAIASLWQVSDGGTQVLMNAFYAALQAGHTKAEALQLAQQALISGEFEVEGQGDRGDFDLVTARTGLPAAVSDNLDHPYYWAPFILIGNGL